MTKFSFEIKKLTVNQHLQGIGSTTITRNLGIKNDISVLMWVKRYRKYSIHFSTLGLHAYPSAHVYHHCMPYSKLASYSLSLHLLTT